MKPEIWINAFPNLSYEHDRAEAIVAGAETLAAVAEALSIEFCSGKSDPYVIEMEDHSIYLKPKKTTSNNRRLLVVVDDISYSLTERPTIDPDPKKLRKTPGCARTPATPSRTLNFNKPEEVPGGELASPPDRPPDKPPKKRTIDMTFVYK